MKHSIRICNVAIALLLMASSTQAIVPHGDYTAATVIDEDVKEDTPVGEYGAPNVPSGADYMTFTPIGMQAYAAGGDSVQVNSWLQFDIRAKDGNFITQLHFGEQGNFTLDGASSDATHVVIEPIFTIRIHEIDGGTTAPFTFFPPTYDMPISPHADGRFDYTDGDGTNYYSGSWSGIITIDLIDYIENGLGVEGTSGANYLTVTVENLKTASSEAGSSALIDKNAFAGLTVTSETVVPEPASVVLMAGAASLITFVRRRFI